MVSFIPQGRMGNFLFQAAACIAYAIDNGMQFHIPNTTTNDFWNPLYLQHLCNGSYNPHLNRIVYAEGNNYHYTPIPKYNCGDGCNIILNGYFQSEKHFINHRDKIIELFGYPYKMNKGVVAIHNRRGDYLIYKDKHPYYQEEWIGRAMNIFPGFHFRFFSDEISYAKEKFAGRDDCSFSEGNTIEQDLIEISQCEHHINSSSTFSWWGAWLNRNKEKIVVTPAQWFTQNWGGLNTKDVIPDEWLKLD